MNPKKLYLKIGSTVAYVFNLLNENDQPEDLALATECALSIKTQPSDPSALLTLTSPTNISVNTSNGTISATFTNVSLPEGLYIADIAVIWIDGNHVLPPVVRHSEYFDVEVTLPVT